jgi:hypothetical protein
MPTESGMPGKRTALLLKSAARMSSGPRPRSWAAGRCHVLFLLLVQKQVIWSKPRFATNRVLVVSEDRPIPQPLMGDSSAARPSGHRARRSQWLDCASPALDQRRVRRPGLAHSFCGPGMMKAS